MDDFRQQDNRQQSRRYRKRVLAVRAMAGETAWLEGMPAWGDRRVVWETDRGVVAPTRSVIALAQRRLGQIGGSPRASRQALGDTDSWLSNRFARLEDAKYLAALDEPELAAICTPTVLQQRDPRVLQRIAAVLAAEAVCMNELPASPSHALLACGGRAVPFLMAVAAAEDQPLAGRAMAALVLGAIKRSGKWEEAKQTSFDLEWEERAFAFGLSNGLTADPAFYVAFLQAENSGKMAEQLVERRKQAANYLPDTGSLRKLLYRGVSSGTVAEICRVCAEIEPIADRIGNYRDELPERPAHVRAERASELRAERAQAISDLVAVMHEFALGVADPEVLRDIIALATYLIFGQDSYDKSLSETAVQIFRHALTLPAHLQGPYLHLLYERRDYTWEEFDRIPNGYLPAWLGSKITQYVYPIATALRKVEDPEMVLQALRQSNLYIIVGYDFKDPEIYRYVLNLIETSGTQYAYWSLLGSLNKLNFSNVKELRQTLGAFLQAVFHSKPESRSMLMQYFLDEIPSKISEAKEKAQRWAQYIPYMTPFLGDKPRSMTYAITRAALSMDKSLGENALPWFRNLIHELDRRIAPDPETNTNQIQVSLRLTAPLASALAGGDEKAFQRIALTALTHSFDHDFLGLEKAIVVLGWFPLLRSAFIRIFDSQPHRCLDLTVKIGLASGMGKDAMAPLGYLEGNALGDVDLPEAWQEVVALAPGVDEAARSYVLAQRVRGERDDVPPGVRKAFEQPQRFATELGFLEQKAAANPGNRSLQARIDSIKERLENKEKLLGEMRVEIDERLGQAGAESHIACAELKMQECYRVRLQMIAGPLPPDMKLTDNLVNATLLAGDIDENRKLLTRLLRAYVQGDPRPHEHHPANEAFLRGLEQAGVKADVWLSAYPKTYVCKGVQGGKVRLTLERDPLSVLQMGNYFDTCLSFGQFNAFSTVANACELNKRVIYAYDGLNRVVGRKLIGINGDGKLVGFYTYSTLGDEEGKELRSIFRRYCADFAKRCGLALAEQGTVPKLYAEAWYDDGVVEWSDSEDAQPRSHREVSRASELEAIL